jgi:hypothetical protein
MNINAYLVYDTTDLRIVANFSVWGKAIMNLLESDETLRYVETSNPKNKEKLDAINKANNTTF